MSRPSAVLIAGPTASGKSALALAIAEARGGVILNADSMQVYTDLAILTARPPPADLERAPHRLYGHVPASQAYSSARWLVDLACALSEARDAGLLPIIVGGTGLYFQALLEGLSPVPPIPPEIRAHWRSVAQHMAPADLHRVLAERDPVMAARLRASDPQRITRALEVVEATGRSLATWQQVAGTPLLAAETTLRIVVAPDRDDLRARCDRRLDAMIGAGALDEVAGLMAQHLDPALPAMRALGVAPLAAALRGETTLDEATASAKADTWRYVKRQRTWLRRKMIAWRWLNSHEMERNCSSIMSILDGTP